MFTYSLIDSTPMEAISIAYDHFSSESFLSSFSYETKLTFYTAAMRTYCYDHDIIVTNEEIHQFLHQIWGTEDVSGQNEIA